MKRALLSFLAAAFVTGLVIAAILFPVLRNILAGLIVFSMLWFVFSLYFPPDMGGGLDE